MCTEFQGFRKVDPDRWEFANEGFLGGQRHLLKTIKRRRNVSQSIQQQFGACVEVGQFGLETDLERLKRDRNVLMAEIVRLRQQQQESRDKVTTMEDRLLLTERKQQQMMSFLAKALNNPTFVQNFVQRNTQRTQLRAAGRKRRLAAAANSPEEFPAIGAGTISQGLEELAAVDSEIENLFSAALDDESSNCVKDPPGSSSGGGGGRNMDCVNETIWEELLSDDLISGNPEEEVVLGDQSELHVEVEDFIPNPDDDDDDDDDDDNDDQWGEDLQELVDQMGYLRSKP